MANYNKVILVGNLTRDPQMSYLPSQTAVVELGLAVNRRYRGQDNQLREDTCFIDCRAYGRQAETINQYMRKGQPILIEGRLQLDTWQAQDGTRRSKHRVIVERFQFLGGAQAGAAAAGPPPSQQASRRQPAAAGPPQGGPQQTPQAGDDDFEQPPPREQEGIEGEDIPF
jgi:single-strand DNA-binding protein